MSVSRTRMSGMAAVAATGALVLAACGGNGGDAGGGGDDGGGDGGGGEGTLLEQLQEEGSITVGIAGEEPYSYMDENGEPTGAAIALAEEVFGALGVDEVEAQVVDWDALIPGLNAGRFDAISAGMSILPERCEQAAFANPEIMYTTALLVPEGNPEDLHNMQDVAESDVTFAAMNGAIEQGYADELGIEVQTVQSPEAGLEAVVSGRADVYALTGISLRALVENNPDAPVEVTEPFEAVIDDVVQVGAGSTVFRQEDTELLEAYNEEAANVIGDPDEYERVLGEFGFTEAERPPEEITTEMLCNDDLPTVDEYDPES